MAEKIAKNSKAYRDYFFTQKWEAGIALAGGEVKSIRAGEVSFKDSYARIEQGEVILYSLHINPYKESSYLNDEPDRPRRLLLHKREIKKIEAGLNEKGLTLVPTRIYFNKRNFVKVEVAIGRGKKQYDKREDIKKRDLDRGLRRAVKMSKR